MYVIIENEIIRCVLPESGYVTVQQDILEYLLVVIKHVGDSQAFICYGLPIELDYSV